ncbi:hypothetical protein LPB41_05795 [Thalassospira sp. MA62]|nr:hypothetical protein [Thalassospira sp. MA62]
MPNDMELRLTLLNALPDQDLYLTSLAPQDGWQTPPPRQLAGGESATSVIASAGELAITLRYGTHHIGIHLGNGSFSIDPGHDAITRQKLDGDIAEVSITLKQD